MKLGSVFFVYIIGLSSMTCASCEPKFVLRSSAFENMSTIPDRYTGHGEDLSPPLAWSGAPIGTTKFSLISRDDTSGCIHWKITGIPHNVAQLEEGDSLSYHGVHQRVLYWGPIHYYPDGWHEYAFTLTALGANDEILGETKLIGRFTRGERRVSPPEAD